MNPLKPTPTFVAQTLELRQRRVNVLTWGRPDAPPVVMLHGWMDIAASFQFVVDALQQAWYVIAPDLRGFGGSEWSRERQSGYWFADYLADVDAMLDYFSPDAPVNLVGHSMGGNIASLYAGVRPERVRRLVSLDGFGIPSPSADEAPTRYRKWLDACKQGETFSSYASLEHVADRLQKTNPRLSHERALWVAQYWAKPDSDGRWHLQSDPAHKMPFPVLYRIDEVIAVWKQVTAPTLWLGATESNLKSWNGYDEQTTVPAQREGHELNSFAARLAAFADIRFELIEGAGHMLHHDAPEAVARAIEQHLLR